LAMSASPPLASEYENIFYYIFFYIDVIDFLEPPLELLLVSGDAALLSFDDPIRDIFFFIDSPNFFIVPGAF